MVQGRLLRSYTQWRKWRILDLPTQSNTAPSLATADTSGNVSNAGANVANYNYGADWNGQDGNVTTVGSAGANNFYGTADMNGNVYEWNHCRPIGWARRVLGLDFARARGRFWGMAIATFLRAVDISRCLCGDAVP